jgi:hypothetical protein
MHFGRAEPCVNRKDTLRQGAFDLFGERLARSPHANFVLSFGTICQYFTFDAHLQWFVMGKGGEAFIPFRHYGENGGLPNKERLREGHLRFAGEHHADNFMSKLHFRPQYASGSFWRFAYVRIKLRLLGIARLLSGRWIVATSVHTSSTAHRVRMLLLGAFRLAPSWARAFMSRRTSVLGPNHARTMYSPAKVIHIVLWGRIAACKAFNAERISSLAYIGRFLLSDASAE